jgi:transposase
VEKYKEGIAEIEVVQLWKVAMCPKCAEISSSVLAYVPRRTRDLSISGRRVYLKYQQRRFRCYKCNKSFLEEFESIQSPAAHFTCRYEKWIVAQVNQSTVESVRRAEGLSLVITQIF